MTRLDTITALKSLTDEASPVSGLPDNEVIQSIADDILLTFLDANGYSEIADAWRNLNETSGGFWYA